MSNYLDRNRLVVNGTLNITRNKMGDDYILVSGTYGEANWVSKQSYVPDKKFDHYVGEHFGGGVVISVWLEKGMETCLVVGTQDMSYVDYNGDFYYISKIMQYSDVVNVYAGASYSTFGATNSVIVSTQPGHSTSGLYSGAAQYCLNYVNPNLGTGVFNDWYLPSIMELMTLGDNLSVVNRVLYELGHDIGSSLLYDKGDGSSPVVMIPATIDLVKTSILNEYDGYWSSTEADALSAYILDFKINTSSKQCSPAVRSKNGTNGYFRARPFRIATDNQVSFNFDADWIIITYRFLDGNDLDTRTRMIYPNSTSHPTLITPWNENVAYNSGVNGGPKSVNFMGHTSMIPWATSQGATTARSYTPNVSETTPAPNGFYNPGTYSVLRWGGDVTGQGGLPSSYETMLVSVDAFKFHFPGVDTIRIDCRGWWFNTQGSNVVRLGVNMYKGGTPVLNVKQWNVPDATSDLLLDSLDVPAQSIYASGPGGTADQTPEGLQKSTRIAIVEYNINTKIGKIIK